MDVRTDKLILAAALASGNTGMPIVWEPPRVTSRTGPRQSCPRRPKPLNHNFGDPIRNTPTNPQLQREIRKAEKKARRNALRKFLRRRPTRPPGPSWPRPSAPAESSAYCC